MNYMYIKLCTRVSNAHLAQETFVLAVGNNKLKHTKVSIPFYEGQEVSSMDKISRSRRTVQQG